MSAPLASILASFGRTASPAGIFLATAAICAGPVVHAEDLGQDALRDIVEDTTWVAEGGWGFWSWAGDNKVCVRVYTADGDCSDTGSWSIENAALCYELEWWGEPYGLRKNCLVVRALGEGRYETLAAGSAVDKAIFAFSVTD